MVGIISNVLNSHMQHIKTKLDYHQQKVSYSKNPLNIFLCEKLICERGKTRELALNNCSLNIYTHNITMIFKGMHSRISKEKLRCSQSV